MFDFDGIVDVALLTSSSLAARIFPTRISLIVSIGTT